MIEFILPNAWLIPFLPFLGFALIALFIHRWPKISALISIILTAAAFVISVIVAGAIFGEEGGAVYEFTARWLEMSGLRVDMGLLLDPLSAVMLIVVTSIATLVQIYSLGYMKDDPGFASYYAYQSLFAASMLGLVLSNNFGQMFVFWELVGICSYFLIGFWFGLDPAKNAAIKAFVTNRVGDFGFLLGILFLQIIFGTLSFTALADAVPAYTNMALLVPVAILLFLGPMGKSAQFPLHVWLPDAMEGPTPVSALIHAATMVAAGVYLVARAFFIFSSIPEAMTVIAVIGGFTALFAASIALVQNDIKRILAYSTLSQLGYMMMAMGVGAMTAGMFHLTTHAFFKSLLFLGAGSVIHALGGEQDIRQMGKLYKKMPVTTWTFIIGALALAGIPPLSGFWSKDEILLGAFASGHYALYAVGAFVAFLTAFYMFRLIFMAFFGSNDKGEHAHESPVSMTVPLVILAFAAVFVGFVNSPFMNYMFGHFVYSPMGIHPDPSNIIMVTSSVIAVLGILLAWAVYQKEYISHLAIRERFKGIYQVLLNKYYFDEMYDYLGKIFVYGTARIMFWIDIYIVNAFVDLIASWTGRSGEALKYTEDGQVQSYAMYMVAGALILVVIATMAAVSVIA